MPPASATFCQAVYAVVELIPPGKVLSYKSVAVLSGYPSYARQVGQALKRAPGGRHLPCHRVVTHSGRLVPHWKEQRELLLQEGVRLSPQGTVDMQQFAWRYDDLADD